MCIVANIDKTLHLYNHVATLEEDSFYCTYRISARLEIDNFYL